MREGEGGQGKAARGVGGGVRGRQHEGVGGRCWRGGNGVQGSEGGKLTFDSSPYHGEACLGNVAEQLMNLPLFSLLIRPLC